MWLLSVFVIVPIIEIALFIQVGGWIGLWPTLALVVAMALLGSWLLRTQGLMAFADLQRSVHDMRDPTGPLAHGMLIVFAGLLLLTPGFFTDLIGLALLIRPVRALVIGVLARRVRIVPVGGMRPPPAGDNGVIDGEFIEIDPPDGAVPPAGRTRH